jgi:hypothetical protein
LHPSNTEGFKTVRDKVIGAEFQIEADVSSAIDAFIEEFTFKYKHETRKICKTVFENLRYSNLRVLRQSLYNLKQFIALLSDVGDREYILEVTECFLVLFLQKSLGELDAESIQAAIMAYKEYQIGLADYKLGGQQKYPLRFLQIRIPIPDIWEGLILDGVYSKKSIRSAYREEKLAKQPKTQPEERNLFYLLRNFRDIESSEFGLRYTQLRQEAVDGVFVHPGEYILYTNLLCLFSLFGVIEQRPETILEETKSLVEKNSNELVPIADWNFLKLGYGGWSFSFDIPQVVEIVDFLAAKNEESCARHIESKLNELIADFNDNFEKILEAINGSRGFEFFQGRPIFGQINTKKFVAGFLTITKKQQGQLVDSLLNKYRIDTSGKIQGRSFDLDHKMVEAIAAELERISAGALGNPGAVYAKNILSQARSILSII